MSWWRASLLRRPRIRREASGLTIGVKQENLIIDNAGAQISRAADPADDDELFIRGLTQEKRP